MSKEVIVNEQNQKSANLTFTEETKNELIKEMSVAFERDVGKIAES